METAESVPDNTGDLVRRLQLTAQDMSGWLKFIGVVQIIIGIPTLIALVGALYIWLGVLLYQAGTAAESSNPEQLNRMMSKLKTFFIITAIMMILGLLVAIGTILTTGANILTLMQQ